MSNTLINLPFKHSRGYEVGIDIFSIDELYERQRTLNHSITEPHQIGFYALLYITSGNAKHTIDFNSFAVGAGTLAIISKHQVQQYDPRFALKGYKILLTEDFLQHALFDIDAISTHKLFEPITTQAYI